MTSQWVPALLVCIASALAVHQAVVIDAYAAEGTHALHVAPDVARQLAETAPGETTVVMVSAPSVRVASRAVAAAGLHIVEELDGIDTVAAAGTPAAVRRLHAQPGVTRIDADPPIEFLDDVAHLATGVAQLRDVKRGRELSTLRRRDGSPYDGHGVTIAMVDEGFDTDHASFVRGGRSKFDVHLRQACPLPREVVLFAAGTDPSPACSQWVPAPSNDDRAPSSGHGTITSSVAAGYRDVTPTGARLSGVAPGARLVGLSIGAGTVMFNAISALHWVLEHHSDPCGDGSCPPIRVVNNSYGLASDMLPTAPRFDPDSPIGRVTTALVRAGVVVVFAAGNDGGDGTTVRTNFMALNPTPGVLMVGAYADGNAGDRDGAVAYFSARGLKGDRSTYPDIVAPGTQILAACTPISPDCMTTAKEGDTQAVVDGTSLSAPYASGVVAQMVEADPSLTPAEIEDVLEDSAHQGFITHKLLEPDRYTDSDGIRYGNADHLTSLDAGHGLIDVVAALSDVLAQPKRTTRGVCVSRRAEVTIQDPRGDTSAPWHGSALEPSRDIVGIRASLRTHPGALTVVVRYDDLLEVDPRMRTAVTVLIDDASAEVQVDRSPTGDAFSVYMGPVEVDGDVDPSADTATFVIRPEGGSIRDRAGVSWAWVAGGGTSIDHTDGHCPIYAPASTTHV